MITSLYVLFNSSLSHFPTSYLWNWGTVIQLNTGYTYLEKWMHLLVRTQENSYGKFTIGVKMTDKISSYAGHTFA